MKKGKAGLGLVLTAILLAVMIAVGCVVNTYAEQISYWWSGTFTEPMTKAEYTADDALENGRAVSIEQVSEGVVLLENKNDTHDRDGMNVLMILPCSTLRNKAEQKKQLLLQRIPVKLKVKRSEEAEESPEEESPAEDAFRQIPPAEKSTEVRLVRPRIDLDELGDSVSGKLRQSWTQIKALNARSVFGKLRWRAHIAAKLRKPPEDL